MSRRAAEARFGVSESAAIKWVALFLLQNRSRASGKMGGHKRPKLAPHRAFLERLRAEKPDITLQALRDRLLEELGLKADASVMSRFFRRVGVTFKKGHSSREQDREDVKRHRERWSKSQPAVDRKRLIFIDETWAKTNMTRAHEWAPRGERLVDKVPHGHWTTATFLAETRRSSSQNCIMAAP